MKKVLFALAFMAGIGSVGAASYENRWVFAIDYLSDDIALAQAQALVVRAQAAGYTGLALISGKDYTSWTDEGEVREAPSIYRSARTGLEGLAVMAPARVARFQALKAFCDARRFDFVPLMWSIGYCSMQYAVPSVATVWPVRDVPYVVHGARAEFVPETVAVDCAPLTRHINCAETNRNNRLTIPFNVKPCRKYRVTARLKTEGVLCAPKPGSCGPYMGILAKSCRSSHFAAASYIHGPATADWRTVGFSFITGEEDTRVSLATGVRQDVEGHVEFADVRVTELGVEYPVARAGTDFVVRHAETGRVYRPGVDYRVPASPEVLAYAVRTPALTIELIPGGALREGDRLLVSCYEPKCVYNDQFGACLTDPALYDYYRRSAAEVARTIGPTKWFLSADEIRISCRCARCRADKDTMGVRIGKHFRAQYEAIKAACPAADIYMWPDMLDVHHNARPIYYLMDSSTEGALPFVPKDITMVCWWEAKAPIILPHFSGQGYRTMGAGFYDVETAAATRKSAEAWIAALNKTPGARGIIYTTWEYGIGRNHAYVEDYAGVFTRQSQPHEGAKGE